MGYSSKPFTQRKRLSAHANSQLASVKLKRKQLFLFYREIIDAQIQLRVFCEEIVKFFGKEKVKLSSPPGAHLGIKSFNGALDKITNRSRLSEVGDLKDCARMTLEFDSKYTMQLAKTFIVATQEFKKVRSYQKALKDRYQSGIGIDGLKKFNVKPDSSGYKDIKFFLKMKNGVIGELQLNTKGMLVAKGKAHVIYDILRVTDDYSKPYTISNPDVVKQVRHHMNETWFDFVQSKVPNARPYIKQVQVMVSKIPTGSHPMMVVSPDDVDALTKISLALYAQGGSDSGFA